MLQPPLQPPLPPPNNSSSSPVAPLSPSLLLLPPLPPMEEEEEGEGEVADRLRSRALGGVHRMPLPSPPSAADLLLVIHWGDSRVGAICFISSAAALSVREPFHLIICLPPPSASLTHLTRAGPTCLPLCLLFQYLYISARHLDCFSFSWYGLSPFALCLTS